MASSITFTRLPIPAPNAAKSLLGNLEYKVNFFFFLKSYKVIRSSIIFIFPDDCRTINIKRSQVHVQDI